MLQAMCPKCQKERREMVTNQTAMKAFVCGSCEEVELQAFDIIDGDWIFTGIITVVPFCCFDSTALKKICISGV